MSTIQVGKLKAEFSSVLEKMQNNGEQFVKGKRKFGILKNKANFRLKDDFAMTDDELLRS